VASPPPQPFTTERTTFDEGAVVQMHRAAADGVEGIAADIVRAHGRAPRSSGLRCRRACRRTPS
jgi:hypothetical protein